MSLIYRLRRRLLHQNYRKVRILAFFGTVSTIVLSASCIPVNQRYYFPTTQEAMVSSTTCAGGPPFSANLEGVGFQLMVYIDREILWVKIKADDPETSIAIDPTLIRVDAVGKALSTGPVKYFEGVSAAAPALAAPGMIVVENRTLTIKVPLEAGISPEVIIHIPPVSVRGKVSTLPEVHFRLEERVRFTPITLNC